MVLCVELDVLLDDTLLMQERLAAAGVATQLRMVPGVTHGFLNRGRVVSAARETLADACAFLRSIA